MTRYIKSLIAIVIMIAIVCVPAAATAQAAADSTKPSYKKYVSLGDSVAAGAGLPLIDDTIKNAACGRSGQAYPHLVASRFNFEHTQLACGGATLPAGVLGPQSTAGLTFPAQVDAAFANGKPDVISLTVGTNDVYWSHFIYMCYVYTCGTREETQAVNGYIKEVHNNLRTAFQSIEQKSGRHQPKVVVTGYFQPLSNKNPTCHDIQGITSDEISWIRWQDKKLNMAIRAATWGFDSVEYAPVDFTGHELCSKDPWLQGLADRASYHPNAAGQAAISRAVIKQLTD